MNPPGHPPRVSVVSSCFRGERHLEGFLTNHATQTIVNDVELVLVLNDPTAGELAITSRFRDQMRLQVIETARETFSASMNRGIERARGEYLCIGNVDDRRTPESLEALAGVLDAVPDAAFAYGRYTVVDHPGAVTGTEVWPLDYDQRAFTRGMFLGPFFMWRADLGREAGPWDEQFSVVGDFDFAVRLALLGRTGVRTSTPLGYYLNEGHGLSTNALGAQRREATAVYLRYGAYDKVSLLALPAALRRHDFRSLLVGGERLPTLSLCPHARRYARSPIALCRGVVRFPLEVAVTAGVRLRSRAQRIGREFARPNGQS